MTETIVMVTIVAGVKPTLIHGVPVPNQGWHGARRLDQRHRGHLAYPVARLRNVACQPPLIGQPPSFMMGAQVAMAELFFGDAPRSLLGMPSRWHRRRTLSGDYWTDTATRRGVLRYACYLPGGPGGSRTREVVIARRRLWSSSCASREMQKVLIRVVGRSSEISLD